MIQGYYINKTYLNPIDTLRDFNILKVGEFGTCRYDEALNYTEDKKIYLVNLYKGTLVLCHNDTLKFLSTDYIEGKSDVVTFKYNGSDFIYEKLRNSYRLLKQIIKCKNYENYINIPKIDNKNLDSLLLISILKEDTGFDIERINKDLKCVSADVICIDNKDKLYNTEKLTFAKATSKIRTGWVIIQAFSLIVFSLLIAFSVGFDNIIILLISLIIPLGILSALIYDTWKKYILKKMTWKNFA